MSTSDKLDPATLTLYLLPDGDVAIESEALSPSENLSLFGDDGVCPPRSVETLVNQCLDMIAAVPDGTDTAALRTMARALKNSLARVETTLAKLNM